MDERGLPSDQKARPLIGVWNEDDPLGSVPAVLTRQPFNAVEAGLTTLSFQSGNDGDVRVAVADQRGDGRPDYLYRGRVLYADRVRPQRIGMAGGAIVIDGEGFRPGSSVTIGGVPALITSVASNEIAAVVSAAQHSGNVDVTVTDTNTSSWATIEAGSGNSLSYDAGPSDTIRVVSAPQTPVSVGVPFVFRVQALSGSGQSPLKGLSVTFVVAHGSGSLGCASLCILTTDSDGMAGMTITALNGTPATVTASLANGGIAATTFSAAAPPAIAPVGGNLILAAGAVFNWEARAIVLVNGLPVAEQVVRWSADSSAMIAAPSTVTDSSGIAWTQATVGPLSTGRTAPINACLAGAILGSAGCARLIATGMDPSGFLLTAVSGVEQRLISGDPVEAVFLRVVDAQGDAIAGAAVNFYENLRLWSSSCPAQGSCPTAPSLGTQTAQLISDGNGLVSLDPLSDPNHRTRLEALAVSGSVAALAIQIDRQP